MFYTSRLILIKQPPQCCFPCFDILLIGHIKPDEGWAAIWCESIIGNVVAYDLEYIQVPRSSMSTISIWFDCSRATYN